MEIGNDQRTRKHKNRSFLFWCHLLSCSYPHTQSCSSRFTLVALLIVFHIYLCFPFFLFFLPCVLLFLTKKKFRHSSPTLLASLRINLFCFEFLQNFSTSFHFLLVESLAVLSLNLPLLLIISIT